MNSPIYLHAIGTAVPPHRLKQEYILNFMKGIHGSQPEKVSFLDKIYGHSAISYRHSVINDYGKSPADYEFFPKSSTLDPFPTTKARNDLFSTYSNELALEASKKALLGLAIDNSHITHLISVSCTGFSAPGFDLHLIEALKLESDTKRYHLGFMGCFAIFPALRLAQTICQTDKHARVLVVSVELCTLHFQKQWEVDSVVANALFADGAGAAIVSAQRSDSSLPLYSLDQFETEVIPQSGDRMAWTIGDNGFIMRLSSYVPKLIESNLGSMIKKIMERAHIGKVDEWAIHPGGRAILDKSMEALKLNATDLGVSYQVLNDYGNMSSATILFVLDRLSKQEINKSKKVFASSFGPGLTVETAILTRLATKSPRSPLFPNLQTRQSQKELMDYSQAKTQTLKKTIFHFKTLNRLFSNFRKPLVDLIFSKNLSQITVADIGSGGGDIPRWLVDEARKRKVSIHIDCFEPDERIHTWLVEASTDYPEIKTSQKRFEEIESGASYDFVISNHLLHHLDDETSLALVHKVTGMAKQGFAILDLRRSFWAYVGYYIFTSLFLRSSFVRFDGLLSIRRSYIVAEIEKLLSENNLNEKVLVKKSHPGRLLLLSTSLVKT